MFEGATLVQKKKLKTSISEPCFNAKSTWIFLEKWLFFYYILELLELSVSPQKHPNKVFHHTKAAYR